MKPAKPYLSFLVVSILITKSFSQPDNSIHYIGEKTTLDAEIFAPGIISTNYVEHSAAAFSPDGSLVLWTVITERGKPSLLMEMEYKNGAWSKPSSPSFSDSTADDFYPSFSVDGKKLYFSSRRKAPAGYPEQGAIRIWEVERTPNGWGKPSPLDSAVFKTENYYHSIARSGNIFTSIRRQGGRVFDIAVYKKDGDRYLKAETLPYNINTSKSEDGIFVAPDESYLIFESIRSSGIDGSSDLYISFRKKDGGWGRPKNMGPKVNSKFAERWPRVSPDGKFLFFGSDRRQGPGIEGSDIYWIGSKVIDDLRQEEKKDKEKSIGADGKDLLPTLYTNDFSKTILLLRHWLEVYPSDENGYMDYFSAIRRSGQYALGEAETIRTQARLPDNDDLKVEIALIKYGLDKREEADKIVSSLPSQNLNHRLRYALMGAELHRMKKYKEAVSAYQIALAIQPRGADFYNLACAYSLSGEKDKAFDALNKAIDNGFNAKRNFETDGDLASLRAENKWAELIRKLDAQKENISGPKK